MRSRTRTEDERNDASWFGYVVALNQGRPREAMGLYSNRVPQDSDWHLLKVLYWNGVIEDIELVLRRADSTARAPFGPTAAEQWSQLRTTCWLALWRTGRGETSGVGSLLQRLEAGLTMGDSVVPDGAAPVCTSLVRATLAVRQGRTDAMSLVAQVDSILLSTPYRNDYRIGVLLPNLLVAALYEELEQPERALAAVRRRPYHWPVGGVYYLSTMLREEGRLAELTGDREGAIRAYTHYLELRADPEPEVLPEVQAVREELAKLLGEPE
jgi:hypothetical protein